MHFDVLLVVAVVVMSERVGAVHIRAQQQWLAPGCPVSELFRSELLGDVVQLDRLSELAVLDESEVVQALWVPFNPRRGEDLESGTVRVAETDWMKRAY